MAPELPEDCYHLIKKAVSIRKHLERNRKDRDAKFRLILVESRIHRLARSMIRHKWNMATYMISHLLYRVSFLTGAPLKVVSVFR